jgi:beta-galactosidase
MNGEISDDNPGETNHPEILAMPDFRKGVVWINGFNLGRYRDRAPQRTIYVPAPLLRKGLNELTLFELQGHRPEQG